MATEYRNVTDHAVTLASGAPVAPGDAVETDMKDPFDKALRDEGALVKVPADDKATTPKKESRS